MWKYGVAITLGFLHFSVGYLSGLKQLFCWSSACFIQKHRYSKERERERERERENDISAHTWYSILPWIWQKASTHVTSLALQGWQSRTELDAVLDLVRFILRFPNKSYLQNINVLFSNLWHRITWHKSSDHSNMTSHHHYKVTYFFRLFKPVTLS